ncbi:hypothetical protein HanPI659440_Chr15g0599321 [Helianthus annuus]|nr:hypothetical protein HanPI659440_Chr15g0599321 [Helianthus annuus]
MMLAREPPRINLTCSSIAPESLRLHALAIDLAFQSVSSVSVYTTYSVFKIMLGKYKFV